MISASLYIVVCSTKNRIRKRLARLREPRYLVGAIAGLAYFYFWFSTRARAGRRPPTRRPSASAAAEATAATIFAAAPSLVGIAVLLLAAVAWVLPFDSGLLEFSDAETEVLFPAPVSRRQLLLHRLLRSQAGILFGSIIIAIGSPVGGWKRFQISIGMWLLFLTTRVYYTGVTLARSRRSTTAWAPLAALGAAIAMVGAALVRAIAARPLVDPGELAARVGGAVTHGAAAIALWPFAALVRPLFADSAAAFAAAVSAGVVVLGVAVAWMLHGDDAFQDAAARAAARRVERAQTSRGGAVRARATGLSLALTGPPEPAFFWKNGVQTLRLTGLAAIRIVVAFLVIIVAVTSAVLNTMHLRGGAAAACAVAIAVAGFTAVLGPQIVRTDMRSDLLHLDLLKTWPVRPAAVVRGELAWPATLLTVVGWAAIACAAAFSPAAFPQVPALTRASLAGAALLLMPALVFAQYLVQNAAAIAFPGWVPLGNQRPRGVDAMGQRLIMLGATLLTVTALMLPGAVAGGAIWFAFQRWIGAAVFVPAAAVCTAIVMLEIAAATELLGPLFDRLDILAVERTE